MKNLPEILKGWFKFKEWSSYQNQPNEFSEQLSKFGKFTVYNNFKELLMNMPIYLEDYEGNGNDYAIDDVLSSQEKFDNFIESQFNFSRFHTITFDRINEPVLYAQASDTTEPLDFIVLVENIKTENDLIVFIDEVLRDIGEVTHSTGLRNKYEVISIDKE